MLTKASKSDQHDGRRSCRWPAGAAGRAAFQLAPYIAKAAAVAWDAAVAAVSRNPATRATPAAAASDEKEKLT